MWDANIPNAASAVVEKQMDSTPVRACVPSASTSSSSDDHPFLVYIFTRSNRLTLHDLRQLSPVNITLLADVASATSTTTSSAAAFPTSNAATITDGDVSGNSIGVTRGKSLAIYDLRYAKQAQFTCEADDIAATHFRFLRVCVDINQFIGNALCS